MVGNALSRGNPLVEAVLDRDLPYTSGPAWLREHVLEGRHVIAVAGTHGKTTTSSMLAWILRENGIDAGYLIGGIANGLGVSGRLGQSRFFVIEADEYDSAFFDKRSKFVHYRPRTLVINNLEFDHADIFPDLAAIQRQFHHLLRMVPASGLILYPGGDAIVEQVLQMGCWSERQRFRLTNQGADWSARLLDASGSCFAVARNCGDVDPREIEQSWSQRGAHNVSNALAAVAAAAHVGVEVGDSLKALGKFVGVRRRLELLGTVSGVTIYDDFAHHPTAIQASLQTMRQEERFGTFNRSNRTALELHAHGCSSPGATPRPLTTPTRCFGISPQVPTGVSKASRHCVERRRMLFPT